MKQYYVYIMVSEAGVLYVGMTNNIKKRVYQHKNHLVSGFTEKYNVDRLVYFETMSDASSAINREKQLVTLSEAKPSRTGLPDQL